MRKKNLNLFCKAASAALCVSLILTFAACSSTDYDNAVSLMESGDYEAAIELFEELGTYEDSADKLSECKYNLALLAIDDEDWESAISYLDGLDYQDSADLLEDCQEKYGMSQNADYAFLDDLEAAVTKRLEQSDEDESYTTIVNTEIGRLEEYADATFYNSRLEELAMQYLDALQVQKDALDEEYVSDFQIAWLEGMVTRYETLVELHDEFGLFEDDDDFVDNYVSQLESKQEFYNEVSAFYDDIMDQWDGKDTFTVHEDYTLTNTYVNNTEYTLTFYIDLYYYDVDQTTLVDTATATCEKLAPGDSVELSWYFPLDYYLDENGYYEYSLLFDWEVL